MARLSDILRAKVGAESLALLTNTETIGGKEVANLVEMVEYTAGQIISSYSTLITSGNSVWKLDQSVALPYMLEGSGLPEGGALFRISGVNTSDLIESAFDLKVAYESNPDTNAFTDEMLAKLSELPTLEQIESLLAGLDVKTMYEANADTNVFTDAEKLKLCKIEEELANPSSLDALLGTMYSEQFGDN